MKKHISALNLNRQLISLVNYEEYTDLLSYYRILYRHIRDVKQYIGDPFIVIVIGIYCIIIGKCQYIVIDYCKIGQ